MLGDEIHERAASYLMIKEVSATDGTDAYLDKFLIIAKLSKGSFPVRMSDNLLVLYLNNVTYTQHYSTDTLSNQTYTMDHISINSRKHLDHVIADGEIVRINALLPQPVTHGNTVRIFMTSPNKIATDLVFPVHDFASKKHVVLFQVIG